MTLNQACVTDDIHNCHDSSTAMPNITNSGIEMNYILCVILSSCVLKYPPFAPTEKASFRARNSRD